MRLREDHAMTVPGQTSHSPAPDRPAPHRPAMTDEQRKSVVLAYLKALDHGGKTVDGVPLLDLFADDAQVYFPTGSTGTGRGGRICPRGARAASATSSRSGTG
ncbi:hypothetical protein [Streptomyces sp. NPDC087300]|uniref:hypothetical protein n=1 Tax=Streptomyces sp. NPDC087300 TaxID=3365780 RepID=UPI00382EB934